MVETDVRPPTDAPEWIRCEQCAALVYGKRFVRGLHVCPECGWHARLTAGQRVEQLLDPGSLKPIVHVESTPDPLEFVDVRPYPDRLLDARTSTGMREAVLCGTGRIEQRPVVTAVMDFRFLGGSLGCGVGALITEAAHTSLRLRHPLLLVTASGGARMQEGVLSLMQMAKTAQALAELDEAGILVVSLITDPTYGGVAASFASLADVIIAEPGARMGFAGPRVIEQTTGETLPEGFQRAEFLLEHGMVDDVVPRSALRPTLGKLLGLHPARRRPSDAVASDVAESDAAAPDTAASDPMPIAIPQAEPQTVQPSEASGRDSWQVVRLARHPARPTTLDYVSHLLEDFHELHGDRLAEDCPAIVGGPGRLSGRPVMLIGHQKGGPDLADRHRRRFGMPAPAGYRKAARLMRMAAKLGLPLVTLIDTPGANPGPDAERGGQAIAIAENLRLLSRLPVPIVAVLIGEGGSGGALALAVADRVLISTNGIYSVISPEGCAAILWKDRSAAPTAAGALRLDAGELLRLGVVDSIVPEPAGGAHQDHAGAAALLGSAVSTALAELAGWEPERLLRERRSRYHGFGVDAVQPAGRRSQCL